MARPTQREVAKTEMLNIRVTPTLKAALRARAQEGGRLLSQECELRLTESLEYDFVVTRSARAA
jgi:hypothetical protein